MPRDVDNLADAFRDEKPNGWMSDFLADEDQLDGRTLWRLGSWGVGAIASLVAAVMVAQSSDGFPRRDQLGLAQAAGRSQQTQLAESQSEARRLAAAVETLNKDRDRLYSRVTVLEQGLDSVTGSIARPGTASRSNPAEAANGQTGSLSAANPNTAASKKPDVAILQPVGPVASAPPSNTTLTPVPPSVPSPPIANTEPPSEAVAALSTQDPSASPERPIKAAEFGVDLGGANSIDGLRALWRGLLKSNKPLLGALQPIIVMKEGADGLGMRLRLVAGPLSDAAAAADICAVFTAAKRPCETSAFDGQKLSLEPDKARGPAGAAPRKRPQPVAEQKPQPQGSFSTIFGSR